MNGSFERDDPRDDGPDALWSPPPAGGVRRLRRSRDDRLVFGVCGGAADYLGIDPTVVRVAFVALLVMNLFAGVLLYGAAWLLVPDGGVAAGTRPARHTPLGTASPPAIVGLVLILVGASLLAHRIVPSAVQLAVWPLLLIGVGVMLLVRGKR